MSVASPGGARRPGHDRTPATADRFLADLLANPHNRAILQRWQALALPDGWLVAGCLFQAVWNLLAGHAPGRGVKDYDLFYFDAQDLTAEGERRVQARVDDVLADLGITAEAKNQARVHLWYPQWFGHPYPPLRDASDGIDRFLVAETCVAVRPHAVGWQLYAPHGVQAVYGRTLSPNPLTDHRELFDAKARSYAARWPQLRLAGG